MVINLNLSLQAQDESGIELLSEIFLSRYFYDLKIYQNYCYIAGAYGVMIYDISDPSDPQMVNRVGTPGSAQVLDIAGKTLYVADLWDGVHAFNLEDPTDPYYLSSAPVRSSAVEIAAHNDLVCVLNDHNFGADLFQLDEDGILHHLTNFHNYGFSFTPRFCDTLLFIDGPPGVSVFSVVNPAEPIEVGLISREEFSVGSGYYIDGRILYDTLNDNLQIIDISDLENPYILGSCEAYGGAVLVRDDIAYLYNPGLVAVDVMNPRSPVIINRIGRARQIDMSGSIVYGLLNNWEFLIYDLSDMEHPQTVGGDTVRIINEGDIGLVGNNLFIITRELDDNPHNDWLARLRVISIEDPVNPVEIGSYQFNRYTSFYNFIVYEDYMYGFEWPYIFIMSLADPTEPQFVDSVEVREFRIDDLGRNYIAHDDYIFSSVTQSGLYVLSIEDREHPAFVGVYEDRIGDYPLHTRRMDVDANYIYIAGSYGALRIYQRNDDGTLSLCLLERYIDNEVDCFDIKVSGDYGFIGCDNRIIALDLGDRREIDVIGEVAIPGCGLELFGNYLFSIGLDIKIISIENPENPHLIGLRDIYASATCYAFDLNRKLLATLGCCLSIFDCCGALGVDDVKDDLVPQRLQLSAYPNPFNADINIEYNLPFKSHIELEIYDLSGHRVQTLVNEPQKAGYHTTIWDGRNENNIPVSSGLYFYRINAGNFTKVRKMTMIK